MLATRARGPGDLHSSCFSFCLPFLCHIFPRFVGVFDFDVFCSRWRLASMLGHASMGLVGMCNMPVMQHRLHLRSHLQPFLVVNFLTCPGYALLQLGWAVFIISLGPAVLFWTAPICLQKPGWSRPSGVDSEIQLWLHTTACCVVICCHFC